VKGGENKRRAVFQTVAKRLEFFGTGKKAGGKREGKSRRGVN